MSVLDIRVLGDPILRQETTPVAAVTDDIRRLIDDMFETMRAARGIGLAAPQVGRTERVTVIDVDDGSGPIALVNPEIIARSGTIKGEEGCLSIPDVFGDVERAATVTVRALDRTGAAFTLDGSELMSRCLQHEIDHLHGRLFIDHLSVLKRRAALDQWARLKEKYPGFTMRPAQHAAGAHKDSEL